eukprot:15365232-Ditylum_brightwellii.AAC.1
MTGVITPKAQPIDEITGKILKGYCKEEYNLHILNAPLYENGQPISISGKFVLNDTLQHKTWCICGFKQVSDISKEGTVYNSVVNFYSKDQILSVVEKVAGPIASQKYRMVDNELDTDSEDGS